jgi:pimeloyl-ACP methyl ester carboxylesterase
MATFVLVHGAWHGGWCWSDVATELRAAGHGVLAPTLSGVAERSRLAPHTDLSLHVEELAGLLYFADVREVVLVGHSYGGMVVSGAAARSGARIARLVYLDAFVPDDGQSLFDLLRPGRREHYESSAQDGLIPSPPPEDFGVVERADWLSDRLTPQPLRTFSEPLELPSQPPVRRAYVRCTQGPLTASFAGFAQRFRDTAGWDVVDFESGHDAMIIRPTDLAALLST